jgi:hydroxymethylpyrimidine pyrophosphatase-like HAD family hydrolase
VLPAGAGKGAAMEHVVRARFGFAPRDTVAAGDGANDLLMLQAAAGGGAAAICVGNAQPELRAWAEKAAAVEAGGNHGGEAAAARVHLASPDAPAAAGVLQGLVALGFFE